MKLSVNYSEALITLLRASSVEIDAIEWVDKLELGLIAQRRAVFPGLPFTFTLVVCKPEKLALALARLPASLPGITFRFHPLGAPANTLDKRTQIGVGSCLSQSLHWLFGALSEVLIAQAASETTGHFGKHVEPAP